MSKKAKDKYELLWEMVYHNPKEVKGTPARIEVKVDTTHPISQSPDFYKWIEKNRDQIANAVVKCVNNKQSTYRCLKIYKVPFYSDV